MGQSQIAGVAVMFLLHVIGWFVVAFLMLLTLALLMPVVVVCCMATGELIGKWFKP
jgi:hypothetical protein